MRLSLKFVSPKLYIHNWVALLLMVLLTLIAHPSHAQSFQMVPDRAESVTLPARAGNDLSPLKPRRAGVSPVPFSISIDPVSQERKSAETATVPPPGTPYKIGFGRDVPQLSSAADTAVHLQWRNTPQAGNIAAISITSPQAVGIRLGILVRRLPAEATLRFYAQGAEVAYEISGREVKESIQRNLDAGDGGDAALTYWSPHIDSEEATLEIELPPGISPDTVEISIPRISHFFRSPLAAQGGNIIKSIGDAASCEIDATCYSAWSPESNATAKMTFVDTGGYSYLCTGTLLNDMTSSGTPYFLSANHCISKQTVASTLQTYWFYRSASCNSGTLNPGNRTLSGGATLLYASSVTDTSFLRLNNTPPAGTMYAGWDSNAPALVTPVTGVHHPSGDLQKISFGSIQAFEACTVSDPISGHFTCNASTQTSAEYLEITFTSGITEGGSSGSGLFKTSGGTHYLIGQLYGGDTSCSNPNGSNDYGRFDVAYNAALHQWLSAGSTVSLSIKKLGNGSGTVTSAPSGITCGTACSAPFAGGTSVTLTATADASSTFTGWSGACSGTGTSCSLVMNADNSVTATFTIVTITLGMALNNTSLDWTTGGDAPFTAQTTTSHSGGSAAQTGKIGDNQSTYLATSVTGPGALSFYWKVSSELKYDIFSVYLDGNVQYYWSGNTAWYKSELTIPAGTHTVKWEYVKDSLYSSGQDAGWVDDVVFTPSATCTYSLTPGSDGFAATGALGVVTVTTSSSSCSWSATSNASWITITAGSVGTGNGTVSYSVSANTGTSTRSGTMTIAGKTFTVTQYGSCTYTISPANYVFSPLSGTGSIAVTTSSSSCAWTAASNNSWITVTSGGSGTGNGTVGYTVATNSGLSRTGTITIGGQTFTVTQQASANAYFFDTVQKFYIGYYQRAADPGGLIYWAKYLFGAGGASLMIDAFANSAEATALYPTDTTPDARITSIFTALFAGTQDTAGHDYYVAALTRGYFLEDGRACTAATIMLDMLGGASGNDYVTIGNKLYAANLFTATIDPGLDGLDFQASYGTEDLAVARAFLAGVAGDPLTVPTQAETTAYIQANIADPGDPILSDAPAGMVLIPAGSFQMGDGIDGIMSLEIPVHTVTLSAFYLDKYEVTKALWDEVKTWAIAHGYTFDNAGAGTAANHPVQTVSWYDVVKWLNARSEKENRTPVYYTDVAQTTSYIYKTGQVDVTNGMVKWTANGYRLPTEAEWEYAARARTTTRFYTGSCISTDQANFDGAAAYYGCPTGRYRGGTTVVGSFAANPWGLYDMAGNVWERTWDWSGSYSSSAATNPRGPDSGKDRVFRGGYWGNGADFVRSATRSHNTPSFQWYSLGFRPALSLSAPNAAPVANAGTAQSVVTGTLVTLDGSGSSDANGDLLTYSWSFTSKPSGSNAILSSATAVKPTFTPDFAVE